MVEADIVDRNIDKFAIGERLKEFFMKADGKDYHGKLYLKPKIDQNRTCDALWISKEKGVLIFDLVEGDVGNISERTEIRDGFYNAIEAKLKLVPALTQKRRLTVNLYTCTYIAAPNYIKEIQSRQQDPEIVFDFEGLKTYIDGLDEWSDGNKKYEIVLATLQNFSVFPPDFKRTNVKKSDSRGAILQELEASIAVLDGVQEKAIFEYKNGVQRIRGLAGSGKTVVLARKAALLHIENPEWVIGVTYFTRSLKNMFTRLIEQYCFAQGGRSPDYSKLKILHAWGGTALPGVYYDYCIDNGILYLNYSQQKNFNTACQYALNQTKEKGKTPKSTYDLMLVDEAQDLNVAFLQLCYSALTPEKRLIYAYDELQKLSEGVTLPEPTEIFSITEDKIDNRILKKCYRNARQALVTAHALGFGVYRKKGLVQFFDNPGLWRDVGYEIKNGNLEAGKAVTLQRTAEATHKLIEDRINTEDLIKFEVFKNEGEQARYIAQEIEKNLYRDELLYKDIIIIHTNPLTTVDSVGLIRKLLLDRNIKTHIAGVSTDPSEFYQSDSIAITGIYRAKGNEAPMVYIINADFCYAGERINENLGLLTKRNTIFTAITRSKAWVRVCGVGDKMQGLVEEFEETKKEGFCLHFAQYPSKAEIEKINKIHRSVGSAELNAFEQTKESVAGIMSIVDKINKGEAFIEEYPEETRPILKILLEQHGKN